MSKALQVVRREIRELIPPAVPCFDEPFHHEVRAGTPA
jgi:hypothetical protein